MNGNINAKRNNSVIPPRVEKIKDFSGEIRVPARTVAKKDLIAAKKPVEEKTESTQTEQSIPSQSSNNQFNNLTPVKKRTKFEHMVIVANKQVSKIGSSEEDLGKKFDPSVTVKGILKHPVLILAALALGFLLGCAGLKIVDNRQSNILLAQLQDLESQVESLDQQLSDLRGNYDTLTTKYQMQVAANEVRVNDTKTLGLQLNILIRDRANSLSKLKVKQLYVSRDVIQIEFEHSYEDLDEAKLASLQSKSLNKLFKDIGYTTMDVCQIGSKGLEFSIEPKSKKSLFCEWRVSTD